MSGLELACIIWGTCGWCNLAMFAFALVNDDGKTIEAREWSPLGVVAVAFAFGPVASVLLLWVGACAVFRIPNKYIGR